MADMHHQRRKSEAPQRNLEQISEHIVCHQRHRHQLHETIHQGIGAEIKMQKLLTGANDKAFPWPVSDDSNAVHRTKWPESEVPT